MAEMSNVTMAVRVMFCLKLRKIIKILSRETGLAL
jgi:hypothetical protein